MSSSLPRYQRMQEPREAGSITTSAMTTPTVITFLGIEEKTTCTLRERIPEACSRKAFPFECFPKGSMYPYSRYLGLSLSTYYMGTWSL